MIGSPLSKLSLFVLLIWLCSNSYAAEIRISNFLLVGRGVTEIACDFIEMKEEVENLTTLGSNKEVIYYFFDTTRDFVRATGVKWWIAAIYTNGIVYLQPVRVLLSKRILKRVISHEYIHFLIDKSRYRLPAWVNEAIAIYFTEELTGKVQKENFDTYNIKEIEEILKKKPDKVKYQNTYQILRGYASMILSRHTLPELLKKPERWFEQSFNAFMDRYLSASSH